MTAHGNKFGWTVGCGLFLATAPVYDFAAMAATAIEECDTLAASPEDAYRPQRVPGVPFDAVNANQAIEACGRAAQTDRSARILFELGRALSAGKRFTEALPFYQAAADQGYAVAESNLGAMYEFRSGVEENFPKAAEWYEKAANHGLARAQYRLGLFFRDGTGTGQPPNDNVAKFWLSKAADQHFAMAEYDLAVLYAKSGSPRDVAWARELYTRAANQGVANAQNNLGLLYMDDKPGYARQLFEKAAAGGSSMALYNLGRLYEKQPGEGPRIAREYYQRAAQAGNELARDALDRQQRRGSTAVTRAQAEQIRDQADVDLATGKHYACRFLQGLSGSIAVSYAAAARVVQLQTTDVGSQGTQICFKTYKDRYSGPTLDRGRCAIDDLLTMFMQDDFEIETTVTQEGERVNFTAHSLTGPGAGTIQNFVFDTSKRLLMKDGRPFARCLVTD